MIWLHATAGCNFHHGSLKNGWSRETVEVATLKVSNANMHNHSLQDTVWSECVFVACYYGLDIKKPVDQLGWSTLEPGLHQVYIGSKVKNGNACMATRVRHETSSGHLFASHRLGVDQHAEGIFPSTLVTTPLWRRLVLRVVVPNGHFGRLNFKRYNSLNQSERVVCFCTLWLLTSSNGKKRYSVMRSSVSMLEVLKNREASLLHWPVSLKSLPETKP